MVSKKYLIIFLLTIIPGILLYSQTPETLKSKIKLDTTYNHGADIYALTNAGSLTVFGDENGELFTIDKTGQLSKTPVKHSGWINTLSSDSKGNIIASGGSDGAIILFNISSGQIIKSIKISDETITQVQFVSDSLLLATSDKLVLIDIESGKTIKSYSESVKITSLALLNDKKNVLLGFIDGRISVFDIYKFKSTKLPVKHKKKITALTVSEDGKEFISGDIGGVFTIWQLKGYKAIKSIKAHSEEISSILFSRDNKYLITAGWDKNIFFWNKSTLKLELNVNAHKNIVSSIIFNNNRLITASFDNTIKIWSNF